MYLNPFNTTHLADASGAVYVARWTTVHVRLLERSIAEALRMKGFRYIEVLSPCPVNYGRRNRLREVDDISKWFWEASVIRHEADTSEVQIERGKPLILGNFVKRERLSYYEELKNLEEKIKEAAEAKR